MDFFTSFGVFHPTLECRLLDGRHLLPISLLYHSSQNGARYIMDAQQYIIKT